MVGEPPTELLGDLEGQRLRTFGVVGPDVDVHESPRRELAGQLRAKPVHIVVAAVDSDEVPTEDGGGDELHLLEVMRHEHERLHAHRAACAATEFARLPVDAHAAMLNPSSRALVSATPTTRSLNEPVGLRVSSFTRARRDRSRRQAVGAHERREPGSEVDRRLGRYGKQVRVAPHAERPRRDRLAGDCSVLRLVVVGDLERPETELADVDRLGRVHVRALPTAEPKDMTTEPSSSFGHWHLAQPSGLLLVVAAFFGPDPSAALDDWPQVWTTSGPTSKVARQRRGLPDCVKAVGIQP